MREYFVVLVRTEGTINMGLSARAVKNFGAAGLIFVKPSINHLGTDAMGYASNSKDVLDEALCHNTLEEALAPFPLSLGFSRRQGHMRKRDLLLSETPAFLKNRNEERVALVFGNERSGLDASELALCDLCVSIESSEAQPSLNLSHAVAVTLYTVSQDRGIPSEGVGSEDIHRCTQEFLALMDALHYFEDPKRRGLFSPYLEKLLSRGLTNAKDAEVATNVLRRLRGILLRKLGG